MRTIDLVYFNAGGGHRAAALVLQEAIGQMGLPCQVRLVNLLEILDPKGRVIGDNDDTFAADSFLRFTATEDGLHRVRIADANFKGGQAYVYRLMLTTAPYADPQAAPQQAHLDLPHEGQEAAQQQQPPAFSRVTAATPAARLLSKSA